MPQRIDHYQQSLKRIVRQGQADLETIGLLRRVKPVRCGFMGKQDLDLCMGAWVKVELQARLGEPAGLAWALGGGQGLEPESQYVQLESGQAGIFKAPGALGVFDPPLDAQPVSVPAFTTVGKLIAENVQFNA